LTKINGHTEDKTVSEIIVAAIASLAVDYTSLNLLLSNGRDLYVVRCFKKYKDYYTLYYYQLPAGIIICSEPIESKELNPDRWTLLANNSISRIVASPPRIEKFKI
jgi:hypothetical protein